MTKITKILPYVYLADSIFIEQDESKKVIVVNPSVRSLTRQYLDPPNPIMTYYRGQNIEIIYDKKYNLWLARVIDNTFMPNCKLLIRYLVPIINLIRDVANLFLRQICRDQLNQIIMPYYYIRVGTFEGRFSKYILLQARGLKSRLSSVIQRVFTTDNIEIKDNMFSSKELSYDILLSYFLARESIPLQLIPFFLDNKILVRRKILGTQETILPIDFKTLVDIKCLMSDSIKISNKESLPISIRNEIKLLLKKLKKNFNLIFST